MGLRPSLKALFAIVIIVGAIQHVLVSIISRRSEAHFNTGSIAREPKDISQPLVLEQNLKRLGPIFYNIFIPRGNISKQENALRIIREQMEQRSLSGSSQSPIWYILIGSPNMTDSDCQPNCHRIDYIQEGDEAETLHALWDYCQSHPDELVTYIHDKGSFHNTEHNEQTRRTATKSAIDCRIEMAKHANLSQFNVCTGTMIILPQYLSKANMWSAKCSYVRNLLDPKLYGDALKRMYDDTLLHPTLGPTVYGCLQPIHMNDNHLGLGRFAFERWVWSHPDVVPADVIPMGKIDFNKYPATWTPSLGRSLKGSPRRMHLHAGFGDSNFARLEGRLFEWKYLYNRKPENTSWIWTYYEGYEKGSKAFEIRYCPSKL